MNQTKLGYVPHRREFLKQSARATAAIGAPWIVPVSVFGVPGTVAPSDRIVLGLIGAGGMGQANASSFMNEPDVQLVAVCDVDQSHLSRATEIVNDKYGNADCCAYTDFRELLAHDGLDAVVIATPDHWHALAAIAAAKAGKDIYCEKPLANSVGEGRAICRAVAKHDRILQTGSHERSGNNARFACELVRAGRLGKIHTVRVNMPCNQEHHEKVRQLQHVPPPMPIPPGFDYDFWLGHTRAVDYTELRCHFWWRFILAYGGGEMTDRGAHIIDLAQLGLGTDATGPVRFSASGVASATSLYDAFMEFEFDNTYANGVRLVGSNKGPRGVRFEGDAGWLFIHVHGAKLEAEPAELLDPAQAPEPSLGRAPSHRRNFLDAMRSRLQPFAHAEIGHRTATICHLNNLAMRLGRPFEWDPQTEQVVDDAEANALLTPTMHPPWHL
jgi:predicted dehydrogenase